MGLLLGVLDSDYGTITLDKAADKEFEARLMPLVANTISVANYSLDLNGDGVEDLSCPNAPTVTAVYTSPGLYLPTLSVKDSSGAKYTDTAVITVQSREELADMFADIWERMKAALLAGDLETAMGYYTENYRDRYRQIYSAMSPAEIQAVFADTSKLYANVVLESFVEAEVLRQESGKWYSYPVHFALDEYGKWGIYGY